MSLLAQGPARSLELYHSKGDPAILQQVAKYQFLTVKQTAELLPRNVIAVRRRMMQLERAAVLNREQESKTSPWVYFLAEKGGLMAAELGYLPSPRWIAAKAPTHLGHDCLITDFHITLEKALKEAGHRLAWEQWRGDVTDLQDPDGEIELIPDARFTIDDEEPSLLEVVRSYESGYQSRESSLVRKLKAYRKLGVYRVYVTMPTQLRVARLLNKLEEIIQSTNFWFTDEESFKSRILQRVWWTPADFRDRTYSIFR